MGDWTDLLPRAGQGSGIPEAILAQQQGRAQIGAQNAQTQVLGAQFQQLQAKAAQEQQYQFDVANYLKNPTPEATMAMFDKYPDQAKALSQGYAVKDEAARRSDIGYFGSLYSALDKGNTPLALTSLKQRRDADKAAGLDTSIDDEWITALGNNDATAIGTIKGAVLANLAAAAGRDKFAENFGTVGGSKELKSANAGDWVYDQNGNVVFKVPQADQYKSVSPGESLVKIPGGGGGPSSGGGGGNPYDVVLGNGSYGTPPAPLTTMTLGQVYDFGRKTLIPNSKAAGVGKDSRGTIGSSAVGAYQITGETLKRIAPAVLGPDWETQQFTPAVQDRLGEAIYNEAVKNGTPLNQVWSSLSPTAAKNLAGKPWSLVSSAIAKSEGTAGDGGVSVVAVGAPKPEKPTGQRMTPEEVAAEGLDPNMVYYRGTDGIPRAVSGQTRPNAQSKPWPAKTLDARITNDASIENIDAALKLLNPKNNSPEAKDARSGIGFGTGALGEQYTNWNDPKGTPIRALIGQIGGIIIKDISGAAVSVSEDSRLSKWVPKVTDSPAVITFKIQNLKREIALRNSVMDRVGKSQGYRPFAEEQGGAPAPRATASRYSEGQTATGPKGQKIIFRNGKWGPL